MSTIPFQTAFGKHRSCDIDTGSLSEVQQDMRDECDINFIMAKYQKSGLIEHVNRIDGSYGDFMHASDYQTSLNEVLAARAAFDSLPSSLRYRFQNDPAQFLEFVQNDSNRDEMIQLGLIEVPVENVNSVPSESVSVSS